MQKLRLFVFSIIVLTLPHLSFAQGDPGADTLETDTAAVDTTVVDSPASGNMADEDSVAPPTERALEEELIYVDEGVHFFSLESPYHTIISHLYFLQPETYHPDSAAMTLYVKDQKTDAAKNLAIKLIQFMDGAGYFIDPDDLPQDPNYIDSTTNKHVFVPITEVPEIFVYKKGKRWVYSYTTVNAIPKLHRSIFPFGTLEWLPDWMHKKAGGLKIWQYFGIIIYLLAIFLIHKLLTILLGFVLEKVLDRFMKGKRTVEFFRKIARPISLLIIVYLLVAFVPNLQLPIALNKWVLLALRVAIPVYYMLISMQLVNVVMAFFEKKAAKTESTMDDQLIPLLRNLIKGVVVIFFIVVTLSTLKVDVTALVGGVAFGSLAFALAAQDTVKNLFGSLLIFVDRPFQIGDWVIIEGHEGVVEEVSVRSTRIRTFAGSVITIPNGNIASTAINNMGARAHRRYVTTIGVTYDTPPDVIEAYVVGIREIIKTHPTTRKDYFEVHFSEMGDSALGIFIYTFFVVGSWTEELAGRQELLLAIMRLAEDLGVSFAFPTQTLHVESFPEKEALTPNWDQKQVDYRAQVQAYIDKYKERVADKINHPDGVLIIGSDHETDGGDGEG